MAWISASRVSSTRLPCVADFGQRRAEELAAARIAIDRDANGLPADLAVEAQLEPGEPLGVGADEAEHMGGERAVGIHAPRLLEVPHAGNLKRIHGGQLLRQRLPLEPDEGLRRRSAAGRVASWRRRARATSAMRPRSSPSWRGRT